MPAIILYQKLVDEKIIGSNGKVSFTLNDVSINVSDVSVVGNILQEWLGHFMQKNNIYYREKPNTQEFPDFLLSENSDKTDLLEVKAFTKNPNFDIANFAAYARSLREHAYRLDAKYLIFKYTPSQDGLVINDIWLKNVWEICGGSARSPVKIQWKQGSPVNIRPATWYSNKPTFPAFNDKANFVDALAQVIGMAGVDQAIAKNWKKVVYDNYQHNTGNKIS